jgi:hypothetical protein
MTLFRNDRARPRRRIVCYALWAAIGLPYACVRAPSCPPGSAQWQRSELFMGQLRRDGAPVDSSAFVDFVERVVAPALPAGFTLLATQGQYRDERGAVIREPGQMLIVLHHGDRGTERALEQVRTAYRERFDQQSVLRTDVATCASF